MPLIYAVFGGHTCVSNEVESHQVWGSFMSQRHMNHHGLVMSNLFSFVYRLYLKDPEGPKWLTGHRRCCISLEFRQAFLTVRQLE